MSRKRKIIWAIVGVLAVGALVFWIHVTRLSGIYLAEGGLGCIAIKRGPLGWKIEKEYITKGLEHRISSAGPPIRLEARLAPGSGRPQGYEPAWNRVLLLERSPLRRGDWDVIAYSNEWGMAKAPSQSATSSSAAISAHCRLTRRVPYLHRLNDRRVVDYFQLQNSDQNPAAAYAMAKTLLTSHSGDLHVRALYLSAAAHCDDTSEVARRVTEWKSDFEKRDDPFLNRTFGMTETWLRSRRLSAAGRNAYDFCNQVLGRKSDLPTHSRRLSEIFEYDTYLDPHPPDVYDGIPNFLEVQVVTKVSRVVATFWMIEGKREESLQLLAASYRLGQVSVEGRTLIQALIGVAVEAIASAGLELYALNCCESDAEFQQLWTTLDRLNKTRRPFRWLELAAINDPLVAYLPDRSKRIPFGDAETYGNIADSRFELVRMATAAKYRLVSQGGFPKSNDQFGPFLPQGPPRDPFSDGPMRLLSTSDSLICYSIGPDKNDNNATITYDPTNGTISVGDIWTRVPRQRRYPFPREGVRAANEEDFWRQFPNGLPTDLYATQRGRSLSTTTSLQGDLCVYSFGPDVDEFKRLPERYVVRLSTDLAETSGAKRSYIPGFGPVRNMYGQPLRVLPHALQVPYDPTNGAVSEGDIFMRVPKP